MKKTDNQFVTDRRNALKILGLSSVALFAGGLGGINPAQASDAKLKKKPVVFSDRSSVAFVTGTDRRAMMHEVIKPFEKQIRNGVKGKQLIIKPNMVSTTVPLCATHVDALRGLKMDTPNGPVDVGEDGVNRETVYIVEVAKVGDVYALKVLDKYINVEPE